MTTLISLILIPLDLIAADWTIKWAKMSRRRGGGGRGMFGQRDFRVATTNQVQGWVNFQALIPKARSETPAPLARRG